MHAVKGIISSK